MEIFVLKRFYPDDYVDSAYEIPYEELYKKGYRGIVFDVDNTLAVSYTHLTLPTNSRV